MLLSFSYMFFFDYVCETSVCVCVHKCVRVFAHMSADDLYETQARTYSAILCAQARTHRATCQSARTNAVSYATMMMIEICVYSMPYGCLAFQAVLLSCSVVY